MDFGVRISAVPAFPFDRREPLRHSALFLSASVKIMWYNVDYAT